MKLSITRALTEIKTLKARINKQVLEIDYFAVQRGKKLTYPSVSVKPEDFEKEAREDVQSLETLINRVQVIKFAIDHSNNVTKIVLGGKEMTISEALAMKSLLDLKKVYCNRLKTCYKTAQRYVEEAEFENQKKIEEMTNLLLSKDSKEKEKESILQIKTEEVEKTYPITLLDPAKCQEKIKVLEEEIELFSKEIDYLLSESNAKTEIEIPD